MALDTAAILDRARACIRLETEALTATADALGEEFVTTARAVEATVAAGHKLIFSGVGKSANIAQKLTGTFNSTGVSSCFLDATQALHGDLGLCDEGDLAVLLSNSGQSQEILRLVPILRRFGLTIVALTGNAESDLAREAHHRLLYRVPREACPLDWRPRPAPLRPSRWAMPWPWCCSKAGASRARTSRGCTPPATSARSCS
jgi:arabinose-5-phosphate isomerase